MDRAEAIEILSERVSIGGAVEQNCMIGFGVNVDRFDDALDMAIAALREQEQKQENKEEIIMENMKETYYIVRCDRAGVFAGYIKSRNGREVVLTNVRRLWYWDGAASLSQMAVNGVTKPRNCKFTVTVPEIVVLDAIEILACSDKAEQSIRGVPEWKM